MRELSHPLMGLLCRADDHPRQPPPHAACCCCAGRDRLAAGVRCSWRSRLGVVSCLTSHETFLWGAVASASCHPPQRKVWRCSQGTHPRSARSGGDPPSADACLQPFSTHWLIFSHVHIHPKGDSLCRAERTNPPTPSPRRLRAIHRPHSPAPPSGHCYAGKALAARSGSGTLADRKAKPLA